jgi:hypothetical protein
MAKVVLSSVYDALREAGASDAKARQAAEDVASYDATISGLRTEVRVVQALGGVIVVLMAAILWQLVTLSSSMARLDERMAGFDQRMTAVEGRLVQIERRLDEVDQRLGAIEQRPPAPR